MASSEKPSKRSSCVATAAMAAVYAASEPPNIGSLELTGLQLGQRWHVVRGQQLETVLRRIAAARVSQQHQGAGRGQAAEPGCDAFGRWAFVAHVTGKDGVQTELARRAFNEIGRGALEADAVQLGVEALDDQRDRIKVTRQHVRGAKMSRGDGGQTAARAKVEHAPAVHKLWLSEQVARESLAAGPGERPERRRLGCRGAPFSGLPQRHELLGQVQPKFGYKRRRANSHELAN